MRKIRFYLYFNSGYVTLLTYTTCHCLVVYASWHTHQGNELLCMPIGIHNNQANGWVVVYVNWHTQHANGWDIVYANWHTQHPIHWPPWLLCMPIGLLCMQIGIHNSPLSWCVCKLAYMTGQWYCVC